MARNKPQVNKGSSKGKTPKQKERKTVEIDPFEHNGYVIRSITKPCLIAVSKDAKCFVHFLDDIDKDGVETSVEEMEFLIDGEKAFNK